MAATHADVSEFDRMTLNGTAAKLLRSSLFFTNCSDLLAALLRRQLRLVDSQRWNGCTTTLRGQANVGCAC